MKKIDAKLEEDGVSEPERKAFKAGAQAAALKIAGSFKDKGYQFVNNFTYLSYVF